MTSTRSMRRATGQGKGNAQHQPRSPSPSTTSSKDLQDDDSDDDQPSAVNNPQPPPTHTYRQQPPLTPNASPLSNPLEDFNPSEPPSSPIINGWCESPSIDSPSPAHPPKPRFASAPPSPLQLLSSRPSTDRPASPPGGHFDGEMSARYPSRRSGTRKQKGQEPIPSAQAPPQPAATQEQPRSHHRQHSRQEAPRSRHPTHRSPSAHPADEDQAPPPIVRDTRPDKPSQKPVPPPPQPQAAPSTPQDHQSPYDPAASVPSQYDYRPAQPPPPPVIPNPSHSYYPASALQPPHPAVLENGMPTGYPPGKEPSTFDVPGNLDSLADGPEGPGSRPPYPYSTIIRYAIEGAPRGMLTLSEIYEAVEARFPYFKTAGVGWKNSIRHNLSLNRLFEKKARAITEPGKGAYWTINKGVEAGPKRVRKRKPRGKKAKAAAEAAAAAALLQQVSGGHPVGPNGHYPPPPHHYNPHGVDDEFDGPEYEDEDGDDDDEDEDGPTGDDDEDWEPGSRPPRKKRRRSEAPVTQEAPRPHPPHILPPQEHHQYQPYPPHQAAYHHRDPYAAPYDARYENGHPPPPPPPPHPNGGVIDPALMDRSGTHSSSTSGGGAPTPPTAYQHPAPHYYAPAAPNGRTYQYSDYASYEGAASASKESARHPYPSPAATSSSASGGRAPAPPPIASYDNRGAPPPHEQQRAGQAYYTRGREGDGTAAGANGQ